MDTHHRVTTQRVIDGLCASSERASDHTVHTGFAPSGGGYEFGSALGAWTPGNPIRLLPDGGDWPYAFQLAADAELAMIEYVEGDLFVRVYDDMTAYRRALVRYAFPQGEPERTNQDEEAWEL